MSKKTDAGSPGDWLDFAGADLEAVNLLAKQNVAFRVCRSKLAEALEKILKADLISRGWVLEKTHDLQRLADFLSEYDQSQTEKIQAVIDDLAEAYTQSRYPGFDFDDSEDWQGLELSIRTIEDYRISVNSSSKKDLARLNENASLQERINRESSPPQSSASPSADNNQ